MSDIERFSVCWEKFSEDGWPGLGERLSRIWIDCECSWEHRVWFRGKQFTRDKLVIGCNKYSDITFYTLEEMEKFCYTVPNIHPAYYGYDALENFLDAVRVKN